LLAWVRLSKHWSPERGICCGTIATQFALNAQTGDTVAIAGPSRTKLVDQSANWVLIAGDMTALPAIEANLAQLPSHATGHVVIEIQDAADERALSLPKAMNIQWLLNPEPRQGNSQLVDVVKALAWLTGTPYVWIAGEVSTVRALRSYFAKTKQLDVAHRYTSGYWQIGQDEDAFQLVKRQERD